MAWTTPRTWVTSEVVTAAIMNTHVRDNENWLHSSHAVKLFSTTASIHNVATATDQAIAFNSEAHDTDAYHDTVTNNPRITIPTGLDGLYTLGGIIEWASNSTNGRISYVRKNGTTSVGKTRIAGSASGVTRVLVITTDIAAAGDYYELIGNQDSGGNLVIDGGAVDDTQFFAAYDGA